MPLPMGRAFKHMSLWGGQFYSDHHNGLVWDKQTKTKLVKGRVSWHSQSGRNPPEVVNPSKHTWGQVKNSLPWVDCTFHSSSLALWELDPQTGKFSCTSVPQKVCCQPRAPSTALFCLPFAPWIWLTASPLPLCIAIRAQALP